jgi:hypothetical protein
MKQAIVGWQALGAMALGLVMIGGRPGMASERIKHELTPVADANARGVARLVLRTSDDGRFDVRARNLDAHATYELLAGGVRVGTLSTNGGGSGHARFRSRPHGHDQLLGFDPRGEILTVRSAAGEDVLVASVPAGSSDPPTDAVVCCVPDDQGSECEDRTTDECTAQGGTVSTATSCLPNPCADAPPVDADIVCCLPDDSGPECEDRPAAECAAQGGLAVEATSCDPNPCAATPPADADTRCCLPDDDGAECEDRTPAQCIALGGVDMGPGSCTPNPCADLSDNPGDVGGDDDHGGHGQGGDDPAGDDHGGHGKMRARRVSIQAGDDRGQMKRADDPAGDDRGAAQAKRADDPAGDDRGADRSGHH